jgi:hypothetical protein
MTTTSRFNSTAHCFITILLLFVYVLGCSDEKNILNNDPDITPVNVNARIDPESSNPQPEGHISVIIEVQSPSADIDKILGTVNGTNMRDSLVFPTGIKEIIDTIRINIPTDIDGDSLFILDIEAFNGDRSIGGTTLLFSPFDNTPPHITIIVDSTRDYLPGQTVMIGLQSTDNIALNKIMISVEGAFNRRDSLVFSQPYPLSIDTQIACVIPDTAYFGLEFWITAEAYDINFNSTFAAPSRNIRILNIAGPRLEIHPVSGTAVPFGDSLRFWVVGIDNIPLQCLGFRIERSVPPSWGYFGYYEIIRDSVSSDNFAAIDSIYCAVYIDDSLVLRDNGIYVGLFGYDTGRRYSEIPAMPSQVLFFTEGKIKIAQAKSFFFEKPGFPMPIVDNLRGLVYLPFPNLNQVAVYSISKQAFQNPIHVSGGHATGCMSADNSQLLILNQNDPSLAIINLSWVIPVVDTVIALPGPPYPYSRKIESLSDGYAYILINAAEFFTQLDLATYEMHDVAWSTIEPQRMASSGNRNYLFLASRDTVALYNAFSNEFISQPINDWGIHLLSCNHDGTRYCAIGSDRITYQFKDGIFDGNLSILGSLKRSPLNFNIDNAIFSPNGNDIFFVHIGRNGIGVFDLNTMEITEYSVLGPYWEDFPSIYQIAIDETGTRLFALAQTSNLDDLYFYDIPVEP